jgi:hypothetical protein
MANVSPNYTGAEAEYSVDRLPLRERSTGNHHGFLTPEEGL